MGFFANLKAKNLTKECLDLLDNFWSEVSNDNLYARFKAYVPSVQSYLHYRITEDDKYDKMYSRLGVKLLEETAKDQRYWLSIAIAYSYYLVMNLSDEISFSNPNYLHTVIRHIVKVLEKNGYFKASINDMIRDVDDIVAATQEKIKGDDRITLPLH